MKAAPLSASSVPKVATNGWSFILAIKNPFRKPITAPTARPKRMTANLFIPPTEAIPQTQTTTAIMDPTERSMPPVMMAKVMPMPRKLLIVACSMISINVLDCINRGWISVKITVIARISPTIASSRLLFFTNLFMLIFIPFLRALRRSGSMSVIPPTD